MWSRNLKQPNWGRLSACQLCCSLAHLLLTFWNICIQVTSQLEWSTTDTQLVSKNGQWSWKQSRNFDTSFSTKKREKPSSSETGTSEARRSRQRKTIPYQTNLNSISSHTKSNSCQFTEHNHKRTWNQRCSFQSVLGRVRNHQVKLKAYGVGQRMRNEISRHSTSKIKLYETSGHQFALSVWTSCQFRRSESIDKKP